MPDAKTELYEIKRMGAVAQKNSGRGKHDKGDAILDEKWMVDVKEYAKTFGISMEVWAKTCTDAFRAGGYEPMLKVVLGTGNNRVRLVVHTEDDFLAMKERIAELESVL